MSELFASKKFCTFLIGATAVVLLLLLGDEARAELGAKLIAGMASLTGLGFAAADLGKEKAKIEAVK